MSRVTLPEERAAGATGTRTWLLLMKAHRTLQRHALRSIESLDLGLSDFAILELLLHKGAQKVNDIGRTIELTSGSITAAIDRLEARELLTRELDAADRRSRIVRLTARGKQRIEEAFAGHSAAMDDAADGLTASERATLVRLLKKLGTTAQARLETERGDHP